MLHYKRCHTIPKSIHIILYNVHTCTPNLMGERCAWNKYSTINYLIHSNTLKTNINLCFCVFRLFFFHLIWKHINVFQVYNFFSLSTKFVSNRVWRFLNASKAALAAAAAKQHKKVKTTKKKFNCIWHQLAWTIKSLPSSNVSRGDNRLARTTEYASQVEALIAASLHVIGELHNHNVCHRVTVLCERLSHNNNNSNSSSK